MAALIDRIIEIALRRDFEYSELQGALVAILAGVSFLFSQPTNQTLWAPLFVLCGLTQLYGLLRENYQARRWSALAAVFLWLGLALRLCEIDVFEALLCGSFSLASGWGFVRIGRFQRSPWNISGAHLRR